MRKSAIAVIFVVLWISAMAILLVPWPRVCSANFDRIPINATIEEVRSILGDPGGEEASWKKIFIFPPMPELPEGAKEIRWRSREGVAILHFDQKERVNQKGWYPSGETFSEKIAHWHGLW
jgi:hypothetical protein